MDVRWAYLFFLSAFFLSIFWREGGESKSMAVFDTFCTRKNQLSIFLLILVIVFLAICVSCSNHHKGKLKENFAWMQDQQNQEEDEPIRYLI